MKPADQKYNRRAHLWTPEEDAELERLVDTDIPHRAIAEKLSSRFGRVYTKDTVVHRIVRLRRRQLATAPTKTSGSSRQAAAPASAVPLPNEAEDDLDIPITLEEPEGPPAQSEEDADAVAVEQLLHATRKTRPLEAVCDELDVSPRRVRQLVELARESGYRIGFAGASIGHQPQADASDKTETPHVIDVQTAGPKRMFAAVGDIHFGHRCHLGSFLQDFCDRAYERGVREFVHPGDLLDGVYKHSRWEQTAHGVEEQTDVAIEKLPRYPGARWWFITGNHDETHGEGSGLDVGQFIERRFRAAGRNDLHYLGARGAYVHLRAPGERRGLFVELWHPRDKASAYAKSYRLQKKVEKYAPGTKPDCLLAGHWHQAMYLPVRGVHSLSVGCWQGGQSSFGKSIGGAPDIGSWIIEYAMTDGGTVREFKQEWVAYYEKETVREVGLT